MKKTASLLFAFFVIGLNFIFSDDLTWTGEDGDNKWDNPANWDGGKVPDEDDNVTIPAGTPECKVNHAKADNIINYGTISQGGYFGMSIDAEGSIANHGTIGSSDSKIRIAADRVINKETGVIKAENSDNDNTAIRIYGTEEIVNYGQIKSFTGGTIYNGGNISLMTSNLKGSCSISNYGTITAADGGGVGGDGGKISINTQNLNNTGTIASGDGKAPGFSKDGTIKINAAKFNNSGTIKGGKSVTKKTSNKNGSHYNFDEYEMGNIEIYADSIFINPDTNLIEGQVISIYCHYLNISNVAYFAGIWTPEGFHVYTTENGTADFSGITQQSAIYSENDEGNIIYSDDIVAPTQGLDHIFTPSPVIYASNTAITGGIIFGKDDFNNPGITDTIPVNMQNQSMLPKVLSYILTSELGWIETISADSPQLDPFEYYTLEIKYTVPEGTTHGTKDTIEMILTIDGAGVDTSYCILECVDSLSVSKNEYIPENKARLQQNFPNPFSDNTSLTYTLHEAGIITLELYNYKGNMIAQLLSQYHEKGEHEFIFNGKNLKSGLYYYVLKQHDKFIDVKTMVLMR